VLFLKWINRDNYFEHVVLDELANLYLIDSNADIFVSILECFKMKRKKLLLNRRKTNGSCQEIIAEQDHVPSRCSKS
jgi:hypothetical protein